MFPWILAITAQAQTTWTVPGDFESVVSAVTAAQSGDTIEIDAASAWTRDLSEDVHVEKDLVFRGVGGRPVLPRLSIVGSVVALEDVTLVGVGREQALVGADVALLATGSSLTLDRVSIGPRANGLGLGIVGIGSSLVVRDSEGEGLSFGPAVLAFESELEVYDSAFRTNLGGSIASQDSDVHVERCTFYGNYGYGGGDILASNTDLRVLEVVDSSFEFSTGTHGSAILATTAALTVTGSTFSEGFAWGSGGAIALFGEWGAVPATIRESSFSGNQAESGGAIALANTAAAVIEDCSFDDNVAGWGGAVYHAFGSLDIRRSDFTGNQSIWTAGTLHIGADVSDLPYTLPPSTSTGTTWGAGTSTGYTAPYPTPGLVDPYTSVTLEDVEMHGVPGESDSLSGGCIYGDVLSNMTVIRGRLEDCDSDILGGAIAFDGNRVELFGTAVKHNSSAWGGGIDMTGGVLHIEGAYLGDNSAGVGGAIRAHQVDATLIDNAFVNNTSSGAGVLELSDLFGFEMHRNRLCVNDATGTGAVVNATGGTSAGFHLKNNVFLFNTSDLGAALRYVPADWLGNNGPPLDVHNNDFVGNEVSAAVLVRGQVDFRNNIVGGHPIGFLLDAAPWGNALTGGYNLWVDNAAHAQGTEGRFPGEGALVGVDPLFQGLVDGDCGSNLWLADDSPARDAGDPGIQDADGSRSDMGAFGGMGAGLEDQDGDGYLSDLDCDDGDPAVHPGVPDIPYDGVDNDCDGFDLCDGDGDGFDAEACGGGDCDDADADVHPRAKDVPDDGIDNDCDGFAVQTWVGGGGGCGCDQGGGGAPWLLLLPLLGVRRARRG